MSDNSDKTVVEGIVTDVNEKLLTFQIVNITIHVVLMTTPELPIKGTPVKIASKYFNHTETAISSVVVATDGDLEADLSIPILDNKFAQLVKVLNLSASDLLIFAKNYDKFRHYFDLHAGVTHDDIILAALKKLKLSRFEFLFVSQMKFVDDNLNLFKEFSYWTFGTHWNWCSELRPEYLIGFLSVNKCTGVTCFTDSKREIPCLLMNKSNNVQNVLDSYILIRDYTFITEIFNCNKVSALEYLVVDMDKIITLDFSHKHEPKIQHTGQYTWCKVISKSSPMVTAHGDASFWLSVVLEETKKVIKLDSSYLEKYPLFQPGYEFDIFYKQPLASTYNKEIYRADASMQQCKVLPDTHFILKSSDSAENILTVSQAITSLTTSNLVSFQGTILLKKFVNPLGSRTPPILKSSDFGTPGIKTHVIQFQTPGTSLALYLNNWENLGVPYGLIPNMTVIVRNVKPQSKSYYKSTAMTSIEIVSYKPLAKCETAILCKDYWGPACFLGASYLIPNATIIYGATVRLFVLGLKFSVGHDKSFSKAQITVITVDKMGESKVIAKEDKCLTLLRLLLKMHEPVFTKWCQGFDALTDYVYYKGMDQRDTEKENAKFLTQYLRCLESENLELFLKCRKMDDEISGTPVYYFLDGRF